ncbi:hypothetical protein RN001_005375 [Aquatica leii]|uniref:WD repeat-containing protein 63 n=1 Tax=Aquatica leii TaxID=1421715 RepID=A0AAN7PGP7_9COLE|nr:hypothetical protein RN001_005375 [Aquatica leii]
MDDTGNIFELECVSSIETVGNLATQSARRKYRKVKKIPKTKHLINTASFLVPGVEKLILSKQTQKDLGCVVDNMVTTDNPWTRVSKANILNSIKSNPDSEFVKMESAITELQDEEILVIYVPNRETEEEEFFICLTVEANATVSNIINQIIAEREALLDNIVSKTARMWKSQGSDIEVLNMMNNNNRSLLEIELLTAYPILKIPTRFHLRLAEDIRDGYVELLSPRLTFDNLFRRRLHSLVQSVSSVSTVSCQTTYRCPKNVSTQYEVILKIVPLTKEINKSLNLFAKYSVNHVYEPIFVNGYFDFYTNDYKDLRKGKYLTKTNVATVKEFSSFYNHLLAKEKMIAAVCWHPMWTGMVAISYSIQAPDIYRQFKHRFDVVAGAVFDVTPVLLWSFADKLVPSLVLETPRDITALSFCPYDENILIGGCINGQIILWDLTNRLKRSEEEIVLSPQQWRYRARMQSLMGWMKHTINVKVVRPVVTSDLEHSHKDAILQISWISPYNEVTRAGKIVNIPEAEARSSLQFTTVSLDGSIQVWNLKGKPALVATKRLKKSQRIKVEPEGLRLDVSPFKPFNRVLKPIYKVNIFVPNTTRTASLTISGRQNVPVSYVEKFHKINTRHTTNRKYFNPILERSSNILENCYVLGTAEGDILKTSWEGYNFNSNELITKEVGKIENFTKFHDGVVVSLALCPGRNDICLSVGGKTFALWFLDYPNKPVIWKKSKYRYTLGKWCSFRHSVIFLSRTDGCVEVWNFSVRSDRFQNVIHVSGGSIAGFYLHTLPLEKEVVGICDYTRALRLFYIDRNINIDYAEENKKFYEFVATEVNKKKDTVKWYEEWNKRNAATIELNRQKLAESKKKIQETKQIKTEESKKEEESKSEVHGVKNLWKMQEIDRMNTVLLNKMGLNVDLLNEQTKPLVKVEKEIKEKQKKVELYTKQASNIFEETLMTNFPIAVESTSTPDPYGGGDFIQNKALYFNNYKDIEQYYGDYVKEHKYKYNFSWSTMFEDAKKRRKMLDYCHERSVHKSRLLKEKNLTIKQRISKSSISPDNEI